MAVNKIFFNGNRYDKAFKPVDYTSTGSGFLSVQAGSYLDAGSGQSFLLGNGTRVRLLNKFENCYQIEVNGKTYWTNDSIWESEIKPYLKQIGGVISKLIERLHSLFGKVAVV